MSKNKTMVELSKALKRLPIRIQKNVATGAIRAGCKPIVKKARENAPKDKGYLRKSIRIRKRKRNKSNPNIIEFTVTAGNTVKKHGQSFRPVYAAYLEFGYQTKSGKAIMATPFMRPAFETEVSACIEETKKYYEERIPKEIEKSRRGK